MSKNLTFSWSVEHYNMFAIIQQTKSMVRVSILLRYSAFLFIAHFSLSFSVFQFFIYLRLPSAQYILTMNGRDLYDKTNEIALCHHLHDLVIVYEHLLYSSISYLHNYIFPKVMWSSNNNNSKYDHIVYFNLNV